MMQMIHLQVQVKQKQSWLWSLENSHDFFDGLKQREYRGKHRIVTIIYSSYYLELQNDGFLEEFLLQ